MSLVITFGLSLGFYFYKIPGYSYRLTLGIVSITLIRSKIDTFFSFTIPSGEIPENPKEALNFNLRTFGYALHNSNSPGDAIELLRSFRANDYRIIEDYIKEQAETNRRSALRWKGTSKESLYNYSRGRAFSYEEIRKIINEEYYKRKEESIL